jgi:hypothetical protein
MLEEEKEIKKRGRKPKEKKEYFGVDEEKAFDLFLSAETVEEKTKIYNEHLRESFDKMCSSIIRTYNRYIPNEDFRDTFDDALGYLMSKSGNFKRDFGFKAYSYCGTVIKNYLGNRLKKLDLYQKKNVSYEDISTDIDENEKYTYTPNEDHISQLNELIDKVINKIEHSVTNENEISKHKFNENDIKVGRELCLILRNWEEMCFDIGDSNKYFKSTLFMEITENTGLDLPTIRKSLIKFKLIYRQIKEEFLTE